MIQSFYMCMGFPGGSNDKESVCNSEDPGSIPGLGRSPGEGNGNPLQYSCLGKSMDRGAWWATVHGVTKSRIGLSEQNFHFFSYVYMYICVRIIFQILLHFSFLQDIEHSSLCYTVSPCCLAVSLLLLLATLCDICGLS